MFIFFFQAEDGIRDRNVTGVQTCAPPISLAPAFKVAVNAQAAHGAGQVVLGHAVLLDAALLQQGLLSLVGGAAGAVGEIGRASWRERGWMSAVAAVREEKTTWVTRSRTVN